MRNMEIILLERVEKLGQMGDVVTVKPGYARNFLIPNKKALRATKSNLSYFDAQKAQLEAENLKKKTEAEAVAGKMQDLSVVLVRAAADSGHLYGSVNSRDIANVITEAGFTVNRSQIDLNATIKDLGLYDISVVLHPEVKITVQINVARSQEEAQLQLERGAAVTGSEDQQEAEEELLSVEELFEDNPEAGAEDTADTDEEKANSADA